MDRKLMPGDIAAEVRNVLEAAHKGKGEGPQALTAYQILDRLPPALRSQLIEERGWPGKGAGVNYSAASVIQDAVEQISGVDVHYLDCRGIRFVVDEMEVEPGYPVCGTYKLRS